MGRNPTDVTTALAMLREAHGNDGWFFTSIWTAVDCGSDRRMLVAQRRDVILSDFTASALSAKIMREG